MATQEQGVSRENLEQINTGTFALDVANYRSILLRYEKEVTSEGFDTKRAAFILAEVTGMQEVVFDRIQRAGRDARKLGVPPEEIEQALTIYRRTLAAAAVQLVKRYEYVFGRDANTFLDTAKLAGNIFPADSQQLASDIRSARLLIDQILRAPDTAFMVLPILVKLLPKIEAAWKAADWNTQVTVESGAQPPGPPGPPIAGGGSGGDGGGDLPRRVDRLEQKMDKVAGDLASITGTLVRMEELLKHSAMKSDIARLEERSTHLASKKDLETALSPLRDDISKLKERLGHMPTKVEMYVAGGGAVAAVLAVVAKGVKWW